MASSTATSATSMSPSVVSSNKKTKRNQHENSSLPGNGQEHFLPRSLESWTDLTWDESSELTLDESTFDILVQSVVANSDGMPLSHNETNPTGMMIVHESTTEQLATCNIATVNSTRVSANDEGIGDVDPISSAVSETMNQIHTSRDTDRASSASFTLNDEMVSWLVGESDFVLQI